MASNMGDYEKKLFEMRLQMQENQSYMQDAFSDLEKWTQDMKEKEKTIVENPDSVKTSSKGLPPIRNLVTKKKKKKRATKKVDENSEEKKSVKPRDFQAWDKLDIDKMCKDVDKEKSSSSDYTTDEEWEQEQRLTRAEWEKERGNQFFKDNLLDEAIECYTRASNLNPNNAIYLANRAMCYLKQNRYAQADADCTVSIALDSNYSKAYHRRAMARLNLGKLSDAKSDFEHLLRLEPNSKLAQIEINKIENALEKSNLVFPIIKSESERSKKPMKRIKIVDVNGSDDETNERVKLKKDLSEIKQKIKLTEKDEKFFGPSKRVETPNLESVPDQVEKKIADVKLDEVKISQSKSIPECPTNGYQFKKDWQYLVDNLENLSSYLKKIPPIEYPKLFLNSLESDNLAKMLEVFNKFFKNDPNVNMFNCLKCLAQVKRFQTQLMFLSQSDKKNLEEIFCHLKTSQNIDSKELEMLTKSFQI